MRILVTGGAGFIGSHLCAALLDRGDEVIIIDDLSTGQARNVAPWMFEEPKANFQMVNTSILDEDLVSAVIKDVDQVYHLAAAVGVHKIMDESLHALTVNLQGTEIVLRACSRYNKRLFVASTSECYGKNTRHGLREDEDPSVIGPSSYKRWNYAASKLCDEFLSLAFYEEHALPVVIGRFFNVIGPRQVGQYGMVVPRFVKQALANDPITVAGDGYQTRCFTDVRDAVRIMFRLMSNPSATGQVFNIGNDVEYSINGLADMVLELTGSQAGKVYVPYAVMYGKGFEDMQKRVPDLNKLRNYIGVNAVPQIPLWHTLEWIVKETNK